MTAAGSAPDSAYRRRLAAGLVLLLLPACVFLFLERAATIPAENGLLAIVIICLSVAPTLVYLHKRQPDPMPALPLIGTFYLIAFGLPVFSAERTDFVMLRSDIVTPLALAAVVGGLLLFFAGYGAGNHYLFRAVRPLRLPTDFRDGWLRFLLWALLIPHWILMWVPALRLIPSVASLLDPAGYVAYGAFYLLWKHKRLPAWQAFAVGFVLLPLEMIASFATGALLPLVMLGLYFQIVYWYANRRVPWKIIVLVCVFFIPLQGVKDEFRRYTWFAGRYSSLNAVEKAELFGEIAWKTFTQPHASNRHFYDSATGRVAHIRLLAYVMERSPSPVPYWEGETYKPLLTKFIPRFLWPEKPLETISHTFGHRYSLLTESDHVTAMNLPWLVELWVNFGPAGLILGMTFYGLMFGYLVRKLNRREMTGLEFVVGATLLFPLCTDQESHFSVVAGNVFLLYWCLWAYFHFGYMLQRRATRMLADKIRLHGEKTMESEDSPLDLPFPLPARPTRAIGRPVYNRPVGLSQEGPGV